MKPLKKVQSRNSSAQCGPRRWHQRWTHCRVFSLFLFCVEELTHNGFVVIYGQSACAQHFWKDITGLNHLSAAANLEQQSGGIKASPELQLLPRPAVPGWEKSNCQLHWCGFEFPKQNSSNGMYEVLLQACYTKHHTFPLHFFCETQSTAKFNCSFLYFGQEKNL